MGQTVSNANIFSWSSESPRSASSSSNECRTCDNISAPIVETVEDRQVKKNFNSFSCFRSYDTSEETVKINIQSESVVSETPSLNKNVEDEMPSSKKCYNFCNNGEDENGDRCADPSTCQHNIQGSKNEPQEINGNDMNSIQSCSFSNSDQQKRGGNSTSINRYVSAFTERIEKMSLDDEIKENSSSQITKSNEFKRSSKQKKSNFRECNGCSKETKNNNNLGAKKKNTWMRFYGSKLGKGNNSKQAVNSNPSTSNPDSTCVCTSYKKVDDNKPENSPETTDPIRHPWQPDGSNQNISNWSLVTGTSNMLYNIQNRKNNCVSCEGSHCHLEWNALADLSNIRRLPINITVTRVGSNNDSQNSAGSGENNLILLSLGTQRPFDSRMRSDEYTIEDCDMRARLRRAFEIDEGIEIPSNAFNAHQFQVVSPEELRALLFQQQIPASATFIDKTNPQRRIHTQVDYIHCLVPDLRSITGCSFYWGKMDRYEAERLLDGKPEGTFLLRDSAQEEYLFSVSFRKYQRSLHARIEQFNHKFSFDSHDPAVFASDTVTGLIEHYKDPTCVMFFEPMLTAPLSRTFTFPLQHLCRAVIVSCTTYDGINELRLPQGIKAYLKEYHYRQRVRVKRFDVSPESSEESQ